MVGASLIKWGRARWYQTVSAHCHSSRQGMLNELSQAHYPGLGWIKLIQIMLTNFNSVYLSKYSMEIFVESCLNIVHSVKQIWVSHLCEATGGPRIFSRGFLSSCTSSDHAHFRTCTRINNHHFIKITMVCWTIAIQGILYLHIESENQFSSG